MFKRFAAALIAVIMSSTVFTGCKSSDSSSEVSDSADSAESTVVADTRAASEAFSDEINKVIEYVESDFYTGTIDFDINIDSKSTDEKLVIKDRHDSAYDTNITGQLRWLDAKSCLTASIDDTPCFDMATFYSDEDGDCVYINGKTINDFMVSNGSWTEEYANAKILDVKCGDFFKPIKINRTDFFSAVDKLLLFYGLSSADNIFDIRKIASAAFSRYVLSDFIVDFRDKAEYDGSDIVIKNINKSDIAYIENLLSNKFSSVFKNQKSFFGEDADPEDVSFNPSVILNEGETLDIRLTYDKDSFAQKYVFTVTSDTTVKTYSFDIKSTADDIDISQMDSAADISDISTKLDASDVVDLLFMSFI